MALKNTKPQVITDAKVAKLGPGQKVYDTKVQGFGIRCQRKSIYYFVRYRSPTKKNPKTGKPVDRFLTLGNAKGGLSLKMARLKAMAYLSQVADGSDPITKDQDASKKSPVGRYIKLYYDNKLLPGGKRNTIRTCKRYLFDDDSGTNGEIERKLGHIPIDKVTPSDIYDLFEHSLEVRRGENHTGIRAANSCYDTVRAMFNYCIRRYELGIANPCQMTKDDRLRGKLEPRECDLTGEELKAIRSSLGRLKERGEVTSRAADCILLMTMTGMRRSEATNLKWDEVDLHNGVLNLKDTKTGRSDRVLNQEAWEFLRALHRPGAGMYVFPGAKDGKPIGDLWTPWDMVRTECGIPHVRLHDLRHIFASRLAKKGASAPMIMKLGGWKNMATMQRYVKLAEHDALREAANLASL